MKIIILFVVTIAMALFSSCGSGNQNAQSSHSADTLAGLSDSAKYEKLAFHYEKIKPKTDTIALGFYFGMPPAEIKKNIDKLIKEGKLGEPVTFTDDNRSLYYPYKFFISARAYDTYLTINHTVDKMPYTLSDSLYSLLFVTNGDNYDLDTACQNWMQEKYGNIAATYRKGKYYDMKVSFCFDGYKQVSLTEVSVSGRPYIGFSDLRQTNYFWRLKKKMNIEQNENLQKQAEKAKGDFK